MTRSTAPPAYSPLHTLLHSPSSTFPTDLLPQQSHDPHRIKPLYHATQNSHTLVLTPLETTSYQHHHAPSHYPLANTDHCHHFSTNTKPTLNADIHFHFPFYLQHTPSSINTLQSSNNRIRRLTTLPMLQTSTIPRSVSPGSPPDLTDSKSSKSSSFPSSSLPDESAHDLRHFEDISLDDVVTIPSTWDQNSTHLRSRPNPLYHMASQTKSLRDLTNVSRTNSSQSQSSQLSRNNNNNNNNHNNNNSNNKLQLGLPIPMQRSSRPRTRHFLNNGSSNLPQNRSAQRSLSISPSATSRAFSPETRSIGHVSSTRLSIASVNSGRRKSWQSTRKKSVQELEDEYDDEDEDVPEDAVIWNVPISPRPAHERDFFKSPTESILSASIPKSDTIAPIPLESIETNISSASTTDDVVKRPMTPNSPAYSDVSSTDYNRHTLTRRETIISELSLEVQELTTALEAHAEECERKQEERIQNGGKHSRPSSVSSSPGRPAKISLPPIRKNDPLVDPLPPSSEKEKHLTRTRPSWLPPKDQKEEKKHLKEFQKMMAAAAEADRKRAEKLNKENAARDAALLELVKSWDLLLNNWPVNPSDKQFDLAWSGVPSQRRVDVWPRSVGNNLGLTITSYTSALARANEYLDRLNSFHDDYKVDDPLALNFKYIKEQASQIHTDLTIFLPETGPLHQSLLDVCNAYASYRLSSASSSNSNLDLSGVPTLAAALLVNLPAAEAFIVLSNLLHRPLPSALITKDSRCIKSHLGSLGRIIQTDLPALHAFLLSLSARDESSGTTVVDDLLTAILHAVVFASPRLSLDLTSRIIDIGLLQGDKAYIAAASAVLERMEGYIFQKQGQIWNDEEVIVEEWSTSRSQVDIIIDRCKTMVEIVYS